MSSTKTLLPTIVIALLAGMVEFTPKASAETYGDIVFDRRKAQETPAAVFPHWFHRIRFRCYVCHPAIFPMRKSGGAEITMNGIRAGKYCGACHDGKTAWEPSFDSCSRCHVGE